MFILEQTINLSITYIMEMVASMLSIKGQVAVKDQDVQLQLLETVGIKQWTKHSMTKDSYSGPAAIKRILVPFQYSNLISFYFRCPWDISASFKVSKTQTENFDAASTIPKQTFVIINLLNIHF